MRRIPIELPEGYAIRFAKKEDIDLIMGISKEWIEQRVRLIH